MIKIVRAATVALALWAASPADATVFRFAFSGAYSADFTLDTQAPTTRWNFFDDYQLLYATGRFGAITASNVLLVLYGRGGQGLDIYSPGPEGILALYGARLYNYPWSGLPLITPQSFVLQDDNGARVRLVISDLSVPEAAVPGPSSWAMMVAGFGAVGLSLRSQRRAGTRSPAKG